MFLEPSQLKAGQRFCLGRKFRRERVPVFSRSKSLADRRFALVVLALFAGVALLLASIGIYGVMAYTFSQRTHEIGIRVALGAQRNDILRMALGEGVILVAVGLGVGLIGALVVTRFLRAMLFSVTPTDPLTFLAIALLLATAALLLGVSPVALLAVSSSAASAASAVTPKYAVGIITRFGHSQRSQRVGIEKCDLLAFCGVRYAALQRGRDGNAVTAR